MSEKPLTLQHPYTDEEARANLHTFTETDDRASPPIFVGREDIIERITNRVAMCKSNMDEAASYTVVIQGPPGSGKTSLLIEIEKRLSSGTGSKGPISVVSLRGGELSCPTAVAHSLIEGYNGVHLNVSEEKSSTKTGGVDLKLVSGNLQSTIKKRRFREQIEDTGRIWDAVIRHTKIGVDDNACLLLVDESQTIREFSGVVDSSKSEANDILMALHDGFRGTSGLKIVPVYAGLPNTESVLEERGVSRLGDGAFISIGALTETETEELVSRWMQHEPFGFEDLFTDSDIRRVSKLIMIASEGWPRHTNSYLKELGKSVLAWSHNDLTVDLAGTLDRGHDRRVDYYKRRVDAGSLGVYPEVIQNAAEKSRNGVIELKTLTTIAERDYQLLPAERKSLHLKAIQAGIIEDDEDQVPPVCKFPIPSLFTFMQVGQNRSKFNNRMREQMDAHGWRR